jgi:hypothetical protein
VSPVKYELGFYIPEGDILHSHCRQNLKSYMPISMLTVNPTGSNDGELTANMPPPLILSLQMA